VVVRSDARSSRPDLADMGAPGKKKWVDIE
jgi:hypothetical protein